MTKKEILNSGHKLIHHNKICEFLTTEYNNMRYFWAAPDGINFELCKDYPKLI